MDEEEAAMAADARSRTRAVAAMVPADDTSASMHGDSARDEAVPGALPGRPIRHRPRGSGPGVTSVPSSSRGSTARTASAGQINDRVAAQDLASQIRLPAPDPSFSRRGSDALGLAADVGSSLLDDSRLPRRSPRGGTRGVVMSGADESSEDAGGQEPSVDDDGVYTVAVPGVGRYDNCMSVQNN